MSHFRVSLRPSALHKQLSSVSLGGMVRDDGKTKRVRILGEEQKQAILELHSAKEIPRAERNRQWSALSRRLKESSLPDGVLKKWSACSSDADKPGPYTLEGSAINLSLRFEFLKCFMVDPSMQSMKVEAFYKQSGLSMAVDCML